MPTFPAQHAQDRLDLVDYGFETCSCFMTSSFHNNITNSIFFNVQANEKDYEEPGSPGGAAKKGAATSRTRNWWFVWSIELSIWSEVAKVNMGTRFLQNFSQGQG